MTIKRLIPKRTIANTLFNSVPNKSFIVLVNDLINKTFKYHTKVPENP